MNNLESSGSDTDDDAHNRTVSEIGDLDSDTVDFAVSVSGVDVNLWTQYDAQLTPLVNAPAESLKNRWAKLQLDVIGESLLPSSDSNNDSSDPDYNPLKQESPKSTRRHANKRKKTDHQEPVTSLRESYLAADKCINAVIDSIHENRPLIQPKQVSHLGALQAHNQKLKLQGKAYFSVAVKCKCGDRSVKNSDSCCVCQYRRARKVTPPEETKHCRDQCKVRVSHARRQELFELFYNKESHNQQNDYICSLVHDEPVGRVRSFAHKKHRSCTRVYNLPSADPETVEAVKVCQSFFLGTFDVHKDRVMLCMQCRSPDGTFEPKRINGLSAVNKRKEVSQQVRQPVRDFIQSLPAQKPHYSRTQGCLKDAYVDLEGVHRLKDLYCVFKKARQDIGDSNYACRTTFDLVFKTEYQIGIARPIKDKCNTCTKFRYVEKFDAVILENQEKHKLRAKRAQASKRKDKERAAIDPSVKSFTFDLQSVLYTPFATDAVMFYTRKLAFFNLTVWDQVTKEVQCFLWSEIDGHRGSNEIGTCLYEKLMSLDDATKTVIFYSDTCAGQNRNKLIIVLLIYILESTNLDCIVQKFMESGHSEMEVDSAHSCIEQKRRGARIFGREGWRLILETARAKQPFEVIDMMFNNFYDLKDLANQYNFKDNFVGIGGDKMLISKVKQLKFEKVNDHCLLSFNYGYNDDEFVQVDWKNSTKRGNHKTPRAKFLKKTYTGLFPVSLQKKADLVGLVTQGLIPPAAQEFYLNLPASAKVDDRLANPASDELEVQY